MARSELTLGFVGSGKVEKRNAYSLLRDLIDAEGGNVKFIFPMTKVFWNEALDVVSAYAMDNGIPVEAVVDDTTAKMREIKVMLTGARRQHQSAAVAHKMASLLEEARNGKLIVLWDDEDEAAMDAVKAADEKGVPLLELTRGLDRIELVAGEDGEDEDEPISDEVDEEETVSDEDENAGQDPSEDEIPDEEEQNEEEPEAEEEFEEAEAEEDLDTTAQSEPDVEDDDDDEAEDEFPEDDSEEFSLPEEDESDVAVLDMEEDIVEEIRQVTGMSEFQRRLLAVLENTSNAFVKAIDALLAEAGAKPLGLAEAPKKAASSKPAAARPAKKVAAPVKKAAPAKAPAKKAPPAKAVEKPAVKRSVPTKKAPAKAETNGTGSMSKAQAQKIIDAYRPRRGRPPADVTEARKVLGLA